MDLSVIASSRKILISFLLSLSWVQDKRNLKKISDALTTPRLLRKSFLIYLTDWSFVGKIQDLCHRNPHRRKIISSNLTGKKNLYLLKNLWDILDAIFVIFEIIRLVFLPWKYSSLWKDRFAFPVSLPSTKLRLSVRKFAFCLVRLPGLRYTYSDILLIFV